MKAWGSSTRKFIDFHRNKPEVKKIFERIFMYESQGGASVQSSASLTVLNETSNNTISDNLMILKAGGIEKNCFVWTKWSNRGEDATLQFFTQKEYKISGMVFIEKLIFFCIFIHAFFQDIVVSHESTLQELT